MVSIVPTVPVPRRPLDAGRPVRASREWHAWQEWYENALGWACAPGPLGPQLLTGLRFDVLELPAEAGHSVLRRLDPRCPVALQGETMRLLVAAGSAEELPGLLDWLEWGALPLDLTVVGAGGRIDAPAPPGCPDPQEAAVWVRPPEPGCDVEPTLPALTALSAVGGGGGAPGLVRLVDAAATQCHRIRLRRTSAQPLAFS